MATLSQGSSYPTLQYQNPRHASWPYTERDFSREDECSDQSFYSAPRFVTHIDDHAITVLRQYYLDTLPKTGRILDFCSSWISHLPKELADEAVKRASKKDKSDLGEDELEVIGAGMNKGELDANPVLSERILQDLNITPELDPSVGSIDAATCVVSIDYLIKPRETLASIHRLLRRDAFVHLVISNRCFPTKAVGRWLRVGEQERLLMVADYLWFAGYRDIEILTLCDGKGDGDRGGGWFGLARPDPLWVVRGRKVAAA